MDDIVDEALDRLSLSLKSLKAAMDKPCASCVRQTNLIGELKIELSQNECIISKQKKEIEILKQSLKPGSIRMVCSGCLGKGFVRRGSFGGIKICPNCKGRNYSNGQ